MARKNYPDEFKRDAVALYRDTEGATITRSPPSSVSARRRCRRGARPRACRSGTAGPRRRRARHRVETPEQELARLRAEVSELRAEKTQLATERDILRSAAKYFAGETNW